MRVSDGAGGSLENSLTVALSDVIHATVVDDARDNVICNSNDVHHLSALETKETIYRMSREAFESCNGCSFCSRDPPANRFYCLGLARLSNIEATNNVTALGAIGVRNLHQPAAYRFSFHRPTYHICSDACPKLYGPVARGRL